MDSEILTIIKNHIKKNDFVDIETFLQLALYEKNHGFYSQIDIDQKKLIGSNGHFITSPEISQMFGELIAIWIIDFCNQLKTTNLNLVELGPGNGTLISDILRIFSKEKKNKILVNLYFLEHSEILSKLQYNKISQYEFKKYWYKSFSVLKNDLKNSPTIILANEFFDCLPIQQFQRNDDSKTWHKICLKLRNDELYIDKIPATKNENNLIKQINSYNYSENIVKNFIEYSKSRSKFMENISLILKKLDGCALLIDYGKYNPYENTLQSVYKNKKIHILDKIGYCDYSSLVDFSNLEKIARDNGLITYSKTTQRDFLLNLGINFRAENLAKSSTPRQKRDILSALERLTSKKHMGDIFKVFCISKNRLDLIGINN